MSIKSSKNIDARAAKLLKERKELRSKSNAIRQAIRAKSNAEIVKTVRAFFARVEKNPEGLCEKLEEIFVAEKENIDQISLRKMPKKK